MNDERAKHWKWLACRFVVCACLITAQVSATDLLHANLTALASQPRAGAPFWVEVKLRSNSNRLREGTLEFTYHTPGQVQWTFSTQELALTGGAQSFRFLLPASQTGETDDRSLRLRFVGKDATSDLGSFPIAPQSRPGSTVTIAMGPSSARARGDSRPTWLNFRLERFAPSDPSGGAPVFASGAAVLEPSEFPIEPLGYCAFDMVLLEGADFVRLKEKSIEALGQWLAAGGSLLVTSDAVFETYHAKALRSWSDSDSQATPVDFGPDGRLPPDSFSLARVGFGRLAVMPARPDLDAAYDAKEWRRAAAWVWKLRTEQMESVVNSGALTYVPSKHARRYEKNYRFTDAVNKLSQSLLPKSVRVIPRYVIIALLAGFVLLIGPVDWWLLGKLRARRFTWLLFPLVTAGVTVATMRLARHYLGKGNHRGTLVVTDLAPDGRVVRETRLEVLLPAEQGTLSLDLKRALCVPVQYLQGGGNGLAPGLSFAGVYPHRFTLTRPLQQWSPVLTRQTRIGSGEDHSRVKWDAFRRLIDRDRPWEVARAISDNSGCSVAFASQGRVSALDSKLIDQYLLEALTCTPQTGRASLFSNLSPSGAATLDDMACVESGDERSTLVIAARQDAHELHLWRRLYLH